MLLNEFLNEHRRVEEERNYFEFKLAEQQKQIEALTASSAVTSALNSHITSDILSAGELATLLPPRDPENKAIAFDRFNPLWLKMNRTRCP